MAPLSFWSIFRADVLPMLSRPFGGLRVTGINVLVLAILWLALETALWLWDDPLVAGGWRFQIDPVMGHAHDAADFTRSIDAARSASPSRHFTLGQYLAESADGPLRILALGGSTTDPRGERFTARTAPGPPISAVPCRAGARRWRSPMAASAASPAARNC